MGYGIDTSRYKENKRAVEEKYMGPLVKTVMTRCIQCTRCVRFAAEIAGVEEIGAIGRGEDMEITTYLEKSLESELSGNVIDLCPVGALTSKPYAFTARPWELRKTETIDAMDAVGSNIRVDCRGREVMRILPRLHEEINEEWITDKTRFIWDGLRTQRLDRPYVRKDGRLQPCSWTEAFEMIASKIKSAKPERVGAIAGDLVCVESMMALRDLMEKLGSPNLDCRQEGSLISNEQRANYLFNTTIQGLEDADAVLLVGTNPRVEAPLVNARLRKLYLRAQARIGAIGPQTDLRYDVEWLGEGPQTLQEIADGTHEFAEVLRSAKRPVIILGMGALEREDGQAIMHLAAQAAAKFGVVSGASEDGDAGWNCLNVLHTAASRVGGLDLGFLPGDGGMTTHDMVSAFQSGNLDVLYLLGADELPLSRSASTFIVYQGSHGDRGASIADVILPGAAYTEKNALWVNTEGRVQLGRRAAFPPGEAKEDWAIVRALSEHVGAKLEYDSLAQIRNALLKANEIFASIDYAPGADTAGTFDLEKVGQAGPIDGSPFVYPIRDFYLTNPIARASKTMAECSALSAEALAQAAE